MVDQAELFDVADEIVADGRTPTVHSVRAELSKGGSMRDVGPLFKDWCLSRGFRLRPTREDVPQALQDSLIKAAAEIWAHGRDQGRAMKLNEHAEMIEKLRVMELAYVAARARVEALEERFGIVGEAESGDEPAPGRRAQTIAFWEGLLKKLAQRMGNQQLKPEVAYLMLEPEEHQEAQGWTKKRTWSEAVLGDKMKGRAGKGKIFEALDDGLYRALQDGTSPGPRTAEVGLQEATAPNIATAAVVPSARSSVPSPLSERQEGTPEPPEAITRPVGRKATDVPMTHASLRALMSRNEEQDTNDGA